MANNITDSANMLSILRNKKGKHLFKGCVMRIAPAAAWCGIVIKLRC